MPVRDQQSGESISFESFFGDGSGSAGAGTELASERNVLIWDYQSLPENDVSLPALSHHYLNIVTDSPKQLKSRLGWGDRANQAVPPRGIALLPAGRPSRWTWRGPGPTAFAILISPETLNDVALAMGLRGDRVELVPNRGCEDEELLSLGLRLRRHLDARPASRIAQDETIVALCEYLIRRWSVYRPTPRPSPRLSNVQLKSTFEFVRENLAADLSLKQISSAASLSEYHFSRLFKATVGLSPHQFVISERIRKARRLLLAPGSESSIADIALACGFADQPHLTRHFRKRIGITPARFRRRGT